MKTREWEIGRITNSKGQKCSIYKPFVDALQNPNLTNEEQKKVVEEILRSNRNRPSETSIQYFLENTLEYLKEIGKIRNPRIRKIGIEKEENNLENLCLSLVKADTEQEVINSAEGWILG